MKLNAPSVPQYVMDQISNDSSGSGFNLWFFVAVILVLLVFIVLISFLIFKILRHKKFLEFEEILKRANIYLRDKRFSEARNEYIKMKNIAEKTKNARIREKTILFYNEYEKCVKVW